MATPALKSMFAYGINQCCHEVAHVNWRSVNEGGLGFLNDEAIPGSLRITLGHHF